MIESIVRIHKQDPFGIINPKSGPLNAISIISAYVLFFNRKLWILRIFGKSFVDKEGGVWYIKSGLCNVSIQKQYFWR